jgi:hypothetical protein
MLLLSYDQQVTRFVSQGRAKLITRHAETVAGGGMKPLSIAPLRLFDYYDTRHRTGDRPATLVTRFRKEGLVSYLRASVLIDVLVSVHLLLVDW